MSHDATKVLMGNSPSSVKKGSEVFASSPATYLAGLAVRRNSSSLLSLVKADGGWIGVSMGKALSDVLKTDVLRAGLKVPMLLSRQPARGAVTISSYANLIAVGADTITIGATVFTAQAGAVTPGDATFRAATDNATTAASLAAQINAHATAGALVVASIVASAPTVVVITYRLNTTAGDAFALAYTEGGTGTGASVSGATLTDSDDSADWVVLGAPVYISDDSGKADDPNSAATISNAVYASGIITGIQEDGTEAACVLVDMIGGL